MFQATVPSEPAGSDEGLEADFPLQSSYIRRHQEKTFISSCWIKNEEVRRMGNKTSTLAQPARLRRLNFAFHILIHDSLLKDILYDCGFLDLNKLPKRTWMYEVLKDISLVRDSWVVFTIN